MMPLMMSKREGGRGIKAEESRREKTRPVGVKWPKVSGVKQG